LNAGAKPPVTVVFVDEKKSAVATPGEVLADVAERAGVDIQLGCNQGNCGVCEVGCAELWQKDSMAVAFDSLS
jgi:ferredoxin